MSTAHKALATFVLMGSVLTPTYGSEINYNGQYANGKFGSLYDDLATLPLNQLRQKSIHNAYDVPEGDLYEILRDHSTNIELDFWDWGGYWKSGDWFVTHDDYSDDRAKCKHPPDTELDQDFLSECLATIRQFHRDYPDHDLITVWLDKKQGWQSQGQCNRNENSPCRRFADLDNLIRRYFSDTEIYSPADLKGNYPSLREAALNGNWANLGELKGKIMFVLTGSVDWGNRGNDLLRDYTNDRGDSGVSFIAPKKGGDNSSYTMDQPGSFNSNNKKHIVFYNMKAGTGDFSPLDIFSSGRISRAWGVENQNSHDTNMLVQNAATDHFTSGFWYVGKVKRNSYKIMSKGMCLDLTNNNDIWLYHCHGGINQKWHFDTRGRIHSAQDANLCVDLAAPSNSNGTNVRVAACNNQVTQKWFREGTSYRNHLNGMAIDAPGGHQSNVYIWSFGAGNPNQWWVPVKTN